MGTAANDRWDRLARVCLLAFAAALPHSISLSQAAAVLALLLWAGGLLARRQRPPSTPLDLAILLFVFVTVLAAVFSLDRALSVTKLDNAALIALLPLTAALVRTRRQALVLISVLLVSAAAGAGVVLLQKVIGRGVEVVSVAPGSPFMKRLQPRDVLLRCDGQEIRSVAHFHELLHQHNRSLPLHCEGMRAGFIPFNVKLNPKRLPPAAAPAGWDVEVKVSRSLRARGTYDHPVTYAEVLLQLTALAAGLWLAAPHRASPTGFGLLVVCLLLGGALAATFTRASWAALAVAGLAMLGMKLGWRWSLLMLGPAATALVGANYLLVQWRGVGFYNPADTSIQYRLLMWEDGWRLIGEHPLLGVGMDSVLTHWQELGVRAYQQLGLQSHFHSTPIQLGVERGLVGLAAWLLLMGLYLRLLWRLLRRTRESADGWERGVALGIFGAAVGFLVSGLVHYNFGDSEVVMVFWLLAGVAVALNRLARAPA